MLEKNDNFIYESLKKFNCNDYWNNNFSISCFLSKISKELKDCYSLGTEEIKINLYNIGIIKIKFLIYSLLRSFRFMHM